MSHKVTFIIRTELGDLTPLLEGVQQMLLDELPSYLEGWVEADDVMVEAHPEGAPVEATAVSAPVRAQLNEALEFAREARVSLERAAGARVEFTDALSDAHRAVRKMAQAVAPDGRKLPPTGFWDRPAPPEGKD